MDNVIIINQEKLEKLKQKIRADGAGKLQVISDFDKTLTKCFVGGRKINSLISILRDEHYLTANYPVKAKALYDYYRPLEQDPHTSLADKNRLMEEWWRRHYELLIESGLSKADLEQTVKSNNLVLRDGSRELFGLLETNNVPLLILSATGLGAEGINLFLTRNNLLNGNIEVFSNSLIWDEHNRMTGVREPIIHSYNKSFLTVRNYPVYQKLKDRTNVILLGNSLADADMIDGFQYDNLIKIGFLNEYFDEQLADFKNNYDIIIKDDGPMDYINHLLKELVSAKY